MPCALPIRSEEHTSELQSHDNLVCRLLLEKKKNVPSQTIRQGNTRQHGHAQEPSATPQHRASRVPRHCRSCDPSFRRAFFFFLITRGPPISTPFPYTPPFR